MVGRITYGFGIAFSMHAAPVYISEMAPADVRGLLVSLKEGFIVGGIMMGFAVSAVAESIASCPGGDCLDKLTSGFSEVDVFRVVWGVPLAIAPVVLLGMKACPPSPRWLLLRAQRTKASGLEPLGQQHPLRVAALASLKRFRRGLPEELVEAELAEVEATLQFEATEASAGSFAEVRRGGGQEVGWGGWAGRLGGGGGGGGTGLGRLGTAWPERRRRGRWAWSGPAARLAVTCPAWPASPSMRGLPPVTAGLPPVTAGR